MKMKKVLGAVALVATAVTLVGCGGPKIPENTVAAAYVDLDKTIHNFRDVAKMVIGEMPKERRKEAQEEFDEALKNYKENFRCYDLDWALVTVGMDKKSPEPQVAVVVKCDYEAKGKDTGTLKDLVKGMCGGSEQDKFGVPVVTGFVPVLGRAQVAFVKGSYVIAAADERTLEKMVKLYKDGEGETSSAFGDLTDIGGDTIARVQTADVATIADLFGVRDQIEKMGEDCDDEDLADMVLDIGSVTLDVKFSDDVVGAALTLDAGSKELAKIAEGAANALALANRFAWAGVQLDEFKSITGGYSKALPVKMEGDFVKTISRMGRKAVEIDRSGSVVSVEVEVDAEDLAEAVVPEMFK